MPQRQALARLIAASSHVVAFTGAGLSTESGVPDFRSPGGVWSRMKPIPFQDFISREESRREAWTRAFSGSAGWTGAKPNAGHRVLTRLMGAGRLETIITQNVDDLHQQSGAPADKVIELHGNASYATCLNCGLRHELADLREPFLTTQTPPVCRDCGGLVKTATISFGQPLPAQALERAQEAALTCDLFIVLGSSLAVYPAAGLPLLAKRHGAALAIVNRDPTPQDRYADLVLHDELGPTLESVAAHLL